MYRNLLAVMAVLCSAWAAPAQYLTLAPAQLSFGTTYEDQPQSQNVVVTNTSGDSLTVSGYWTYPVYGAAAFSASPAQFGLAAGASQTVTITFAPRHNLLHRSDLVWRTDDPRGDAHLLVEGQGRYRQTYYAGTQNTEEQVLKDSLKARLGRGFTGFSYNAARDEMFMVVDNQRVNGQGASVNTLEGVYTGFTVTGYSNRTDAQNQGFNTEHTYPQGFFNQDLPMRADLFHLFPTKIDANSARGNLPFGVVSNPTWQDGGSKAGNGVFEPRDSHKGPVARAMLYFVLRYQNYANFLTSQEAILRQWHYAFPPDSVEIRRNAAIAALQQNRNPLIDYPQLLDRISSVSGNSVASPVRGWFAPDTAVAYGTVPVGGPVAYAFVLANTGNVPLSLSNLSLSDSRLSFAGSSGADTVVAPGRARVIRLWLDASVPGSLSATLSLSTDVPGSASLSWPITAQIEGTNALPAAWQARWQVVPQPAQTVVTVVPDVWPTGPVQAVLFDSQGRQLVARRLSPAEAQLPLQGLAAGTYWLRLEAGGAVGVWPVQVRP